MVGPDYTWELLDWTTIAFECGFIVAVWRARAFRVLCAVAAVFHAMVLLTLDISFATNLLGYAVFFDWSTIARRSRVEHMLARVRSIGQSVRWYYWVIAAAIYCAAFRSPPINVALRFFGMEDRVAIFSTPADVVLLLASGLLGLGYLASRTLELPPWRRRERRRAQAAVGRV